MNDIHWGLKHKTANEINELAELWFYFSILQLQSVWHMNEITNEMKHKFTGPNENTRSELNQWICVILKINGNAVFFFWSTT